jgi:uncharacterized membrane protein YuzA (DUF378 family)
MATRPKNLALAGLSTLKLLYATIGESPMATRPKNLTLAGLSTLKLLYATIGESPMATRLKKGIGESPTLP